VTGVSFVVPVYNGERTLDEVLTAIHTQADGRPLEILVVDDGSSDRSRELARCHEVQLIDGPRRGGAAAMNAGIRLASYPVICQIDQDVVLGPGWLRAVLEVLERATDIAAVQAHFLVDRRESLWTRVLGLDVELRYAGLPDRFADHVCTGNTAYRAAALRAVGLFDESLGYGYDNDLSYRLGAAGHRLAHCPEARATHRSRSSASAYVVQQYGLGYGRLDLVAKHPRRLSGDQVSGPWMMAHAPGMLLALVALVASASLWLLGGPWAGLALVGGAAVGLLGVERLVAGVRATLRSRDPAGLFFPVAHLLRDAAWAASIIVWALRRLTRRAALPQHSMWRTDR
jgi:GT2 family glycosyltransferase